MMQRRTFIALSAVSALLLSASAFAPTARPAFRSLTTTSQLNVAPPEIADYADLVNHIHHTSQMLADEMSDAIAAQQPTGWWGDYVNFFKSTLNNVHSTIDPPLRSIGFEQTWGVAIAIFTCSARALLLPLSVQQSKSSEYMKALKPYVTQIKQKYKDNQDLQNKAVGKLYSDAKQNPLSGCLVSLAQIPIFLGLYRGIRLLALDGALEEPFLFIPSLEGPVSPPDFRGLDWLVTGWQQIDGTWTPQLGWETTIAFLIMPVSLVLMQSLTMSVLQPPIDEDATDEEQEQAETTQQVLKFLPLLIGFFSLQVPAGLTIYWFSTNVFTLSQTLAVKAYFAANPPEIELPDYWDQLNEKDFKDMTPDERRKATQAGLSVGPTFEELVVESKFHVHVERAPFRETTKAWQRVEASESKTAIPAELEEWVASMTTSHLEDNAANGQTVSVEMDPTVEVHDKPVEADTAQESTEKVGSP